MEKEQITAQIKTVLVNVLEHENFVISDELSAKEVDGWDSLSHMIIITEIEKLFGVKFKLRELNKLTNFGNLVELVSSKL